MNLGERLQATIEAAELRKKIDEMAKEEAARRKWEEDNKTIVNFINGIIESFEKKIMNHGIPKGRKIPSGKPFNTLNWVDSNGSFKMTNHPHYEAFEYFFTWANENGLVGHFVNCHDGMGMDSWFEAKVEAKK